MEHTAVEEGMGITREEMKTEGAMRRKQTEWAFHFRYAFKEGHGGNHPNQQRG